MVFLTPNCLSPVAVAMKCSPMGSHLILSFFFISYLRSLFWFQNHTIPMAFFDPQFFIPRCGSYEMLPYGVTFDSLSFLYLTSGHFFDFKITLFPWPILTPSIFLSPGGGAKRGSLRIPNLRSFCFILTGNICLGNFFWFQNHNSGGGIFFLKFLILTE